ncbi:hypothetical protein [Streptomyces sp. NPDC093094]|uniref:hypothetical protein n=1 Tax=Streptomyces sp. NPDC093094 TaxID=3366026 RepID=UPI00382A2B6A
MRKTGRIIATLAASTALTAVGAGQAQAADGPLGPVLGLVSPLLCGVQGTVDNIVGQTTSCPSTTSPAATAISGYEVVTSSFAIEGQGVAKVTLACPAGKKVLGGGVNADSGDLTALDLVESAPTLDATAWRASVVGSAGMPRTEGHFYAVCADVDG